MLLERIGISLNNIKKNIPIIIKANIIFWSNNKGSPITKDKAIVVIIL